MASNFKPWVDSPTAGQQVQSASVFATDAQRVDGFKAGDPASALRVNSALRQANIVVAGLMQMCDDIKTLPSDLSLMSTVTQVKNAIKAAIDQLDATTLASAKSYTDTREGVINGKITNVQNQVTSNKNRLDALEPRVDDLEKGTPGMTVGEAEMLTEPFRIGFDITTAKTGYVKFASASLPAAYRSATARFEVLDKNPVNAQTNMCGVEVVVRNVSQTSVTVTAQLLYGSSEYLSKIYACIKKGAYPVLVDLYFDITSSNPQETTSCIKPLFTFARAMGAPAFTFISDNVLVTDLPADTTNTQLSTVYTVVTEAKTAEIHTSTQLANNANLNTYYGESYWGRLYYATGNNSIVNRPIESDNNGFSLEILRGGAGGTIQRCTLFAKGGSTAQPVTFTRWFLGTTWTIWEEVAEATGAYPNLGAGYLAKSITVANGTLTKQYYKLCTYTSPKVSKSSSFIFLINGIYGDQPASFAAESGILEFDIRSDSVGVASSMTGLSILSGNLNPNDFFIVISDDLSSVSLYSYLAQQYGSHKITQIDSSKDDVVTFDGTRYSTAPTGVIYAVCRNIASEADAAKQLSRNAILNVLSTNNLGWWEVGKINVDDVKNLSVASTFSVIMLVNGVYPENEYSGFIELDGETADSLWNTVNPKMLCGSFDVDATFEFCVAISSDGKYLTLYAKAMQQFNRLSFTILDEYYSAVRTTYFSFNPQFYGTDAPPNAVYGYGASYATNAENARYASSDHSKGTIEERLTALGFKQGTATVSLVSASVSSNFLKRQGNYVIGKLNISEFDLAQETQVSNGYLIGTIPANFLPKETTQLTCGIQQVSYMPDSPAYQTELYGQMTATIDTNGNIYLSKAVNGFKYTYYNSKWNKGSETASTLNIASTISEGVIYGLSINFAYEAAALR